MGPMALSPDTRQRKDYKGQRSAKGGWEQGVQCDSYGIGPGRNQCIGSEVGHGDVSRSHPRGTLHRPVCCSAMGTSQRQ